jgi:hypothetical protein
MGEAIGDAPGEVRKEGGLHAGPVAIRGGVPVVQAADQAIVAGEGGDGQGAEEVFHVGRHQTEEGPEIPACEKRVRNIRENFEKRRRGDDIDPIPQDIGFTEELEERLRLRPAKEGEPDEGDTERLFAPRKQPLEELPDSPADGKIRLDSPEFAGDLFIGFQDIRIVHGGFLSAGPPSARPYRTASAVSREAITTPLYCFAPRKVRDRPVSPYSLLKKYFLQAVQKCPDARPPKS